MVFGIRKRPTRPAALPGDLEEYRRQAVLEAEREKTREAQRALVSSVVSKNTERARLRDSREIAAALREQVENNGFTERMAESFRLREKGA